MSHEQTDYSIMYGYHSVCHYDLFNMFTGMPGCRNIRPVRRRFIQAGDDLELYYRIAGLGPDTIMVLHGGPGLNFDYLAPDLTPLEEHFTLIYYDQRGRQVLDGN